jgi:GxxExxY protein
MSFTSPKLKQDPRTYAIIGAAMEVHRQLGSGFLESVYQEALAKELARARVPFQREVELPIYYKGEQLPKTFRADFICYDAVVVEVKAILKLGPIEKAQIIHYLKATGFSLGLLINFGAGSLEYRRFINTPRNLVRDSDREAPSTNGVE